MYYYLLCHDEQRLYGPYATQLECCEFRDYLVAVYGYRCRVITPSQVPVYPVPAFASPEQGVV